MKSLGNKSANSKKAHTCNCILLTLSNWLSSEMQTLSFNPIWTGIWNDVVDRGGHYGPDLVLTW